MCVIYGSFSRLKDSLYYEEKGDCMLIVHIYNVQTSLAGIDYFFNLYWKLNDYDNYNFNSDASNLL